MPQPILRQRRARRAVIIYLVPLKSTVTEALRQIFGPHHPEPDFRDLHVSIEYPNQPQNYPGIWGTYDDNGALERAGIDHLEVVSDPTGEHAVTRWRFEGSISF